MLNLLRSSLNSFSLIIALAWRNLWRNRRRTTVILFAIILGVWAMIFTAAFMRGMVAQMLEDSVDNLAGHVQIHHPAYLDDPVINNSFSESSSFLQTIKQDPRVLMWSDRIRVPAVIQSERETTGITLLGVDPAKESPISFIGHSISEGQFISSPDDNGVVIGKALADKLETRLGKRIVLMMQDKDNNISDRGFRIIGIFKAPVESAEKTFVFVGKQTTSTLLNINGLISETSIRLKQTSQVEAFVSSYSGNKNYSVISWLDTEPYLQLMIEMMDSMMFIWYIIVFLAMAFGIINTLLMAVFERTREFGLFQALGQKPRFILFQVWIEALFMLLISLLLGNLLAWLTVIATGDGIDVSVFARGMEMLNMSNIIPFVITFKDLMVANITVAILGMITGLYPAWRASRMVPAEALSRI